MPLSLWTERIKDMNSVQIPWWPNQSKIELELFPFTEKGRAKMAAPSFLENSEMELAVHIKRCIQKALHAELERLLYEGIKGASHVSVTGSLCLHIVAGQTEAKEHIDIYEEVKAHGYQPLDETLPHLVHLSKQISNQAAVRLQSQRQTRAWTASLPDNEQLQDKPVDPDYTDSGRGQVDHATTAYIEADGSEYIKEEKPLLEERGVGEISQEAVTASEEGDGLQALVTAGQVDVKQEPRPGRSRRKNKAGVKKLKLSVQEHYQLSGESDSEQTDGLNSSETGNDADYVPEKTISGGSGQAKVRRSSSRTGGIVRRPQKTKQKNARKRRKISSAASSEQEEEKEVYSSATRSPIKRPQRRMIQKVEQKEPAEDIPVPDDLRCTLCDKTYQTAKQYQRHAKRHGKKLQCEQCGKSFSSMDSLLHHQRGLHSNVKPFTCPECGDSFSFHHSFKLHMQKHRGERPFKCDLCSKTYLTSNHLKVHKQAVHNSAKPSQFQCDQCGKIFSYKNTLRTHQLIHTESRPHKCSLCDKGFTTRQALKMHSQSYHVTEKSFECDICHKFYKSEHLRNVHRRRHTGDASRFMCDICGRQFMFKSNLESHVFVHQEDRPFKCDQCDKSFKCASSLYTHQYTHKVGTPFNCSICSKSFKSKSCCLAHEKRHNPEKRFMCTSCGSCFPDKGGLMKHIRSIHCPQKQFICKLCGKVGTRADNMRTHVKSHGKDLTPEQLENSIQRVQASTANPIPTIVEFPNTTPSSDEISKLVHDQLQQHHQEQQRQEHPLPLHQEQQQHLHAGQHANMEQFSIPDIHRPPLGQHKDRAVSMESLEASVIQPSAGLQEALQHHSGSAVSDSSPFHPLPLEKAVLAPPQSSIFSQIERLQTFISIAPAPTLPVTSGLTMQIANNALSEAAGGMSGRQGDSLITSQYGQSMALRTDLGMPHSSQGSSIPVSSSQDAAELGRLGSSLMDLSSPSTMTSS